MTMKMATKLLFLSLIGLVSASPLDFYHSKTVAFNHAFPAPAPVVVKTAAPPPVVVKTVDPPPTRYVDVDVVQVNKADVVDHVNRSTGQIVGIVGSIASAIGNIVAQTVRDIGELARTARPLPVVRKTVSVPVQPLVTKSVSFHAPAVTKAVQLPPPPQPSITKTIPVPSIQFQTVQKTIG